MEAEEIVSDDGSETNQLAAAWASGALGDDFVVYSPPSSVELFAPSPPEIVEATDDRVATDDQIAAWADEVCDAPEIPPPQRLRLLQTHFHRGIRAIANAVRDATDAVPKPIVAPPHEEVHNPIEDDVHHHDEDDVPMHPEEGHLKRLTNLRQTCGFQYL